MAGLCFSCCVQCKFHKIPPILHQNLSFLRIEGKGGKKIGKKILREELKTFVDNLTLSDDAAFAIGFDGNVSGVQFLVSTITERKDIRVESARAQVSVRVVDGHSVTFDILARDRSGALIDIEMLLEPTEKVMK